MWTNRGFPFVAVVALATLTACFPSPVPITYDVSLRGVQRPSSTQQRYGPQTITQLRDSAGTYRFSDSLITATFRVTTDAVGFVIENRGDTPIQIGWTEAAFVDLTGQSQPVMHSGVRYTDCAATKAPSVIPPRGRLADQAIPCEYVDYAWSPITGPSGWRVGGYLPRPLALSKDWPTVRDSVGKALKGKTLQLLLPIRLQDVVNDYTFTFEVRGVVP